MEQKFSQHAAALIANDIDGQTRSIVYPDGPARYDARDARAIGDAHLRAEARRYGLGDDALKHLDQGPTTELTGDGTEIRLRRIKRIMDTVVLDYCQTLFGLPVWRAGVAVVVKDRPQGVLGSTYTGLANLRAKRPSQNAMRTMHGLMPEALAKLIGFKDLVRKLKKGKLLPPRINNVKPWIYRYDPAARQDEEHTPKPGDNQSSPVGVADTAAPIAHGGAPRLPLPPVPAAIKPRQDYVVFEVLFTLTIEPWGSLNWRALIEPEEMAVLYVRALVDNVDGLVFTNDPVTHSGSAANGPAANAATLDPLRQSVTLLGLNAPSGGNQSLAGSFVTLQDVYTPTIAAPIQATGTDFDFGCRTNDFAAVNAYFHSDFCFRLVDGMGLNNPTSYFDGTTFPLPVDHRGSADPDIVWGGPSDSDGNQVNAQSLGNAMGNGCGGLNFFLANTADTGNPIGIAADKRVVLHEFGHSINYDHVNSPNYGFSHSAGDSLAAVLSDPTSNAPDRFETFPFTFQSFPASSRRRHDRDVAAGWAWRGSNDVGGYSSEQILSTTLFRFYRSIGGDSGDLARRELAARVTAYLIFRGTGMLTPAADAPNALDFANALILSDAGEWTNEGLAGGAYHKVLRWAFEKQGLYQPAGAPVPVVGEGSPPAVDVFIDDGRGGQYTFLANHWSTTDIWNRTTVGDGGGVHEHPIVEATNYAYVKIKNRGTASATNIVVRGFHALPGVGLVYPGDWTAMDTNKLVVANIASGGEQIVGPFEWTPSQLNHECMFFAVSALGDASNIDGRITGSIPEWRLVPNDNNIGQRNVTPVAGGGGLRGLLTSFANRRFWIRNTFDVRAKVELRVQMPRFLARLGWRLGARPGMTFELDAHERRAVMLDLGQGGEFTATDVPDYDRDIDIVVAVGGMVLGGMRYTLDPKLKYIDPLPKRPGRKDCVEGAERILDCLGLPTGEVGCVKVRKVNVDIVMKGECE